MPQMDEIVLASSITIFLFSTEIQTPKSWRAGVFSLSDFLLLLFMILILMHNNLSSPTSLEGGSGKGESF